MLFSKIIDRYALNILHQIRSKEFQYAYIPTQLPETKDREIFYKAHPADVSFDMLYSGKNYKTGTFQFKSLVPSGDLSNDYITGEIFK